MKSIVAKGNDFIQNYGDGTSVSYRPHSACNMLQPSQLAGHAHQHQEATLPIFWPLAGHDDLFLIAATPQAVRDGLAPLWALELDDDSTYRMRVLRAPYDNMPVYFTVYQPTASGHTYVAASIMPSGEACVLFCSMLIDGKWMLEAVGTIDIAPDWVVQEKGGRPSFIVARPHGVPVHPGLAGFRHPL